MMNKFKINPKKCVGCKICELSCAFTHYGLFSNDISNLHIATVEDVAEFTPHVCLQCEDRSCVDACPASALTICGDTGAIIVDQDACVFCEACVNACGFGGIRVIKYEGMERLAVCDMCGGKEPRCAASCMEGAIALQ